MLVTAPSSSETPAQPWHAMPPGSVLKALHASAAGLSTTEAAARLAQSGPNAIPAGAPVSRWRVLATQFRSVVTLLLVGAFVLAALTGDAVDTVAIVAVLVLNVALGFAVEIRAHRAVEALADLEPRVGVVLRDRRTVEVDAHTIVPGDVLVLEAGQGVPADARLLTGEIQINEAALTGESVPVWKIVDAPVDATAPLPDRSTMVYAGTLVVAGGAHAVVVATGRSTELGAIGGLVGSTVPRKTPLEVQLNLLGQQLVWVALLVAAATGVLAWVHGGSLSLVLESAVALAVAAVPEGLPAVATITLALAVHRMAKRHALVRRLPVVETLGSVTVLCTDKTGTLTAGEMTVTTIHTCDGVYEVTGVGYTPTGAFHTDAGAVDVREHLDLELALETGIAAGRGDIMLTESGWLPRGDPTEVALAVAAMKAGIDRTTVTGGTPESGEVPFSSERQFMAIFHRCRTDSHTQAFVKGAPHRVLEMCWSGFSRGTARPLDAHAYAELERANADMAARGLRVLALAAGDVPHADERSLFGLTFVALVGISDPPAAGVKDAIAAFRRSGIRTVMLTGDQRGTAEAIARQLELGGDPTAVTGDEVDGLSDAELERRLSTATVFSRVSPAAKLRLVAAYQSQGDVVAMIGDGVNDAAALKRADVGVTMGRRGTEVARDTATIILTDDRFDTIGTAIAEGRLVFENIRRFVFYLFSCNLAEIIVLLGTSAAGWPLPLAPIQVLWLNLVTDSVPALALAVEPARGDLMQQPPRRPTETIISRDFLHGIGLYAMLIAMPVLVTIVWQTTANVPYERAITVNFAVLGLAQLFHLGNARDQGPVLSWRRAVANRAALAALVTGALSILAVVQIPALAHLLRLVPLTAGDWLVIGGLALIPAVVGQTAKAARQWRSATGAPR
jgi:Ca2+-transporting ATPase